MDGSYLDWYTTGRLSSYLTTSAAVGDSFTLAEVQQPAGDMSDPATPDLVIVQALSSGAPYRADFSCGRFQGRTRIGELYLTPPFVESEVLIDKPHKLRIIAFPSAKYEHYLHDALPHPSLLDFGPLHTRAFGSPIIAAMLDRIWNVGELDSPTSLLFAQGAALVVLAELARLADKPTYSTRGGLAPWAVNRVTEYLRTHMADDVSLQELASVAHLSPFHFARMFKRTMGVAPHAYQRTLRCEHAKIMLSRGRQTVTEIALDVGYHSSQSFARMFRAETGMSPVEWRRSCPVTL